MDYETLKEMVEKKHIESVAIDLSNIDVNDMDFSNCKIINVVFYADNQTNIMICNVKFKNSYLFKVDFSNTNLKNVNFDCSTLEKVSFRKSIINNCRYRNSIIKYSDFRYSEINNSSFQHANITLCDFYRTLHIGNNVFLFSNIEDSSISTYFEGSAFRKSNIANGRILQQDKLKYRKFLEWHEERLNDMNEISDFDIEESFNARFEQAENIFRELNGLWNNKGYISDANWAYIQAKRMERKNLIYVRKNEPNYLKKIKPLLKTMGNWLVDFAFGYGESIYKTIRTYILIILFFTILLYFYVPLDDIYTSLLWSYKNMIAQTPDQIKYSQSFLITLLSVVQSTLGILITGIFGFIIANKIRNQ